MFKGDILVIEDNSMNQQVITEHLSRVGLQTEIAVNGLAGIEKVKQRLNRLEKPYDLIFIDIHMPVMDGTDAAPQIIKLSPATPVVAMTADVLRESRKKYKKLGMTDYLGKPFTSQELWDCLLRYLQPVRFDTYEDNSDAIQNKLRTDFVKSNQSTFDEITSAIDADDITRAHRLAHTLKSSAGLIGKSELQKAAADVESALKNGKNMLTETHMNIFSHELGKVLNEFMPLIAEASNDAESESPVQAIDEETARELFDKLEQLLSSGSPECLKLAGELRRVPGSEKLIAQMEDFYFGAAAETLAALRETRDKE
jgi:CheY-like chemotaxis protein